MTRRLLLAAVLALVSAAPAFARGRAAPTLAHGATPGFSGSCRFSGPISPMPPITLLPVPGAHFSYSGSGTCSGGVPITVTFTNVATLFDTCELGPDLGLHGLATIGTQQLHITINLARLAVAGPFALSTQHQGLALGVAEFATANPTDCLAPGVGAATLTANLQTVRPLR
jgi:hypothetical protein